MSSSPIRLIVGLGNPGSEYQATRHNAGYWFVERIAQRHRLSFKAEQRHHGMTCRLNLPGRECRLLMPATYMNRSGLSVASLANYFRIPPEEIPLDLNEIIFKGLHIKGIYGREMFETWYKMRRSAPASCRRARP